MPTSEARNGCPDRKVAEDQGEASLGKDGCLAGDLAELGSRISCGVRVIYKVTPLSKAVGAWSTPARAFLSRATTNSQGGEQG